MTHQPHPATPHFRGAALRTLHFHCVLGIGEVNLGMIMNGAKVADDDAPFSRNATVPYEPHITAEARLQSKHDNVKTPCMAPEIDPAATLARPPPLIGRLTMATGSGRRYIMWVSRLCFLTKTTTNCSPASDSSFPFQSTEPRL